MLIKTNIAHTLKRIVLGATLLIGVNQTASALPILSFNNAQSSVNETVNIGDTVSFELWFSGLETDDVGGFEFLLGFNNVVSSINSAVGNIALDEFDIFDVFANVNNIDIYAVSFVGDLSAQADEFMFATLTFMASNVGVSQLSFSNLIVSDENASALDISVFDAQITVVDDTNNMPVPTPTSWGLFLVAVVGLAYRYKAHKPS
ncbi:PEP-CTERM sorting domain-containing protein [Paraglaciecola mesophila]|uniref:PEP-CTERM sorting domain-containing protein n=1 Tax=Paraglaciecola mesophila TaxID=197222 RepID=A0ABU9SQM4_9ALTE|tara:strand:- start:5131 stop:5742 length:612 start_codon:yes stop_codon:yes gene_type:complete